MIVDEGVDDANMILANEEANKNEENDIDLDEEEEDKEEYTDDEGYDDEEEEEEEDNRMDVDEEDDDIVDLTRQDDNNSLNRIAFGMTNEHVKSKVRSAAKDFWEEMLECNAVRSPNNPFTQNQMKELSFFKENIMQVYSRYHDVSKKEMKKIGYSANMKARYSEDILKQCSGVVSTKCIPREVDERLTKRTGDLLDEFCNDDDDDQTPYDFRQFCHITQNRGGKELGVTRGFYGQLMEFSCQEEYKTGGPAEAFTTIEDEQAKCRSEVARDVKNWIESDLEDFTGREIKVISTWPVGKRKLDIDLLYSQAEANNYAFNGLEWVDAIENAVYPVAENIQEAYSTDFSEDQIQMGIQRILDAVNETMDNGKERVLCVCQNQEALFPDGSLRLLLLAEYGCKEYDLGDGLASFTRNDSLIIVYPPLGFAMDSRDFSMTKEQFLIKMRRFKTIEILKKAIQYLIGKGDEIVYDTSAGPDALTAGFCYRAIIINLHLNAFIAAAYARDIFSAEEIKACVQNKLSKRDEQNAMYTLRHNRVKKGRKTVVARPIQHSIHIQATNLISHTRDTTTLKHDFNDRLKTLFSKDGATAEVVGKRYNTFVNEFLHGNLKKECEQLLRSMKKNPGNQLSYKPIDLQDNDAVFQQVLDRGEFWIFEKSPTKDVIASFRPSEWRVFDGVLFVHPKNMVYDTIAGRIRPRKSQRNNTNHQKSLKCKKSIKMVERVFLQLDLPQYKPIGRVEANTRWKELYDKEGVTNVVRCTLS